jgi:hypothetical protein
VIERAGRGELRGRMEPREDRRPNFTGSIVLEHDAPAGARFWLSGWTNATCGEQWVSIELRNANGRGPRHRGKRRGGIEG